MMIKHEDFLKLCARKVADCENARIDNAEIIDIDDTFAVWTCKTLQNSKAILSAKNKGAYMYEFTMNGDKEEIYMNVYKKVVNIPIDSQGKEIAKI